MAFIEDLPEGRNISELRERGDRIVDGLTGGLGVWEWVAIEREFQDTQGNPHTLVFYVMLDAPTIEGVRVNVSATDLQRFADRIGAMLTTALLWDETYRAADGHILPHPRRISMRTSKMIAHSRDVDNAIRDAGLQGKLVRDQGKGWILSNVMIGRTSDGTDAATNYGWIGGPNASSTSVTGLPIIQSEGTFHGREHADYSEFAFLMKRDGLLDGRSVDLAEVAQDDVLWPAVSYERLRIVRQPGVPLESQIVEEPPPTEPGKVVTIEPVTIEGDVPPTTVPVSGDDWTSLEEAPDDWAVFQASVSPRRPGRKGVIGFLFFLGLGAAAAAIASNR